MKQRLPKGHLVRVAGAENFHGWPEFISYPFEIETEKKVELTERIIDNTKKMTRWERIKFAFMFII